MSNEYIVQQGDTLNSIARQHGTSVTELQRRNPIIRNPDQIQQGWKITLPNTARAANDSSLPTARPTSTSTSTTTLPPPRHAGDCSTTQTQASSPCTAELVDVVHVTGDPWFYVLTDEQAQALKREVSRVQSLMDELKTALADAEERVGCQKDEAPEAVCSCARCIKDEWSLKAQEEGLLNIDPPSAQPESELTTEEDIQGQLATLRQAREWYAGYSPVLSADAGNVLENNWETLRTQKLAELDAEIVQLRSRLASEPGSSGTLANGVTPDQKYGRKGTRSVSSERGTQRRSGITVVEISLFSQPDRRYYVAARFHEQVNWKTRVSTRVMQGKPFSRQLATQLLESIQKEVNDARRANPLGSLGAKLASWSSDEDNLLNALHKETSWTSNSDDAAPYAISSEAHALRFAASASAGVNSWDPAAGNIEIGAKGSAAFSLGEGAVTLNTFFPSQGGRSMRLAYRNANGDTVLHPFGVFRLHGKLEMSCFVGAQAQASAGAKAQYKPSDEGPGGATALLGSPRIETGRGGYIGVKGDAFAGAQAGGAISGAMQWIEPSKVGRGPIVSGQSNSGSSWTSLAEIKAELSGALGIGAGYDFGLSIRSDRLAFNCNGRLVFGPGASGGFASVVDLENIYKVVKLFCDALAEVDYRYLLCVQKDAFWYLAQGLYQVASAPREAMISAFELGQEEVGRWWERREATKAEATNLANYLLHHRALLINGKKISLKGLPPETLGPMVFVLSESFVESWNEDQESALVLLLSGIDSWRQMFKVLEHCSPKGSRVNAMHSMDRINSILDGAQQRQFNRFIEGLAVHRDRSRSTMLAWQPVDPRRKRSVLIAASRTNHFSGLA
ncbi:LysM peptidoglycan-binding domain-containing protein [Halopseudomonas sp.]|uniref:LysM peptidoglycan-binding domain-containing protein n=1 Tax=Halopseudomonas sp. TaxID=2901191 RepID=UPI003001BC55